MSDMKKCDRCGSGYELCDHEKDGYTKIFLANGRRNVSINDTSDARYLGVERPVYMYDLCPSCMRIILRTLMNYESLDDKYAKKIRENCFSEDEEANRVNANSILLSALEEVGMKNTLEAYDDIPEMYYS